MKASFDVNSREEAHALRAGLQDETLRAIVMVTGLLLRLPSDRARERVLQYVQDRLAEQGMQPNNGGPPQG